MRTKESKFKVSRLDYIEPVEAWKKFESYSNVIFLDSAGEQSENNRYSYLAISPLCNFKIENKKLYKDDIEIEAITIKAKGSKCPVCWKINDGPCPRHPK